MVLMKYFNSNQIESSNSYKYVQFAKICITFLVILFSYTLMEINQFNFYIPWLASVYLLSSLFSFFTYINLGEKKKYIPYISSIAETLIACSFIYISKFEYNTLYFWCFSIIASNYFFTNIKFVTINSIVLMIFGLFQNVVFYDQINSNVNDEYHVTFLISILAFGCYNFIIFFLIESNRAEINKRLEGMSEYNRSLIDALPGFVSWVDYDLKYLGVNKHMCQFFNQEESEFLGRPIGELTGINQNRLATIVKDFILSSSSEYQDKFNYIYHGKTYHNVLSLVKYGEGVLIVSFDVTKLVDAEYIISQERQRAQTSARLANFGEVSAGIAHEINNPLAVISALNFKLGSLKKKEKLDDEFLESFIGKVDNQINHISKIVKSIKNLSRDGDKDPFESKSLQELVEEVKVLVEPKCNGKNIDLQFPDNFKDNSLMCQSVQLGQVFIIMINNAVDAISSLNEKWIKVSYNDYSDGVEFIFEDSGPGITEKLAQHIFMPFFTTKGVGEGTGLGLSLAVKIIKLHHGEIRVDHSSQNTKFIVYIPKEQTKMAS